MKRILLQTDDALAARDEAKAKGAHVSQIFGRQLVEVMAPPDFDETQLTTTRTPDVTTLGDDEKAFHQAWHLPPAPAAEATPLAHEACGGPSPPPGVQTPPGTANTLRPGSFGSTLTGIVAIRIFMTELTVTDAEGSQSYPTNEQLISTLSQVIADNTTIVGWSLDLANLTFALSVESPVVSIASSQTITFEQFAVATLKVYDLAFDSPELEEYLAQIAEPSKAGGAGLIFVTSSPFLSGSSGSAFTDTMVTVVSLSPNDSLLPRLYAHELFHMFGAGDEYCEPGRPDCEYLNYGAYKVPNCNCCASEGRPGLCGSAPQSPCIMASGLQNAMCGWTGQQLGWSQWMFVGANRNMARVTAGLDGSLWGVDSEQGIYFTPGTSFWGNVTWQDGPPGKLQYIYAYSQSLAYGLDQVGKSYIVTRTACMGLGSDTFSCLAVAKINGAPSVVGLDRTTGALRVLNNGKWTNPELAGSFGQVVCAYQTGQLWMVGKDGVVYTTPNSATPVARISTSAMVLTQIAVSPDGRYLYGVNGGLTNPTVLYWNGSGWPSTGGYVPVPSVGETVVPSGEVPVMWGQNGDSLYRRYILSTP